jgi:tetratricopeptide (TPR) repeat protein
VQRSANAETITHLTAALELLKIFPDTPERTQQELTLQLALGVPLQAAKGIAAPEVGKVYIRALELCRQGGEIPQLFSGLVGLRRFYLLRAELRTAYELGEQLLSLAQKEQDSLLLLEAYYTIGFTLLCLGEFNSAQEHLEQGIALYDAQQHHSHALSYGYDPGVWFPTSVSLV